MPPVPIFLLAIPVKLVVVDVIVVPFANPHIVRTGFMAVPMVIVAVIFVINSYPAFAAAANQRNNNGSGQNQGPNKTAQTSHFQSSYFSDHTQGIIQFAFFCDDQVVPVRVSEKHLITHVKLSS